MKRNKNYNIILIIILILASFILGVILSINKINFISGICIGSAFLAAHLMIIYSVFSVTGSFDAYKKLEIKSKKLIAILYVVVNVFILVILTKQRYAYFWDFGGYWGVTIEKSSLLFEQPLLLLKDIYTSINTQEYNNLIPGILALPMALLGKDFQIYALINLNLFVLPSIMTIIAIITKIESKSGLFTGKLKKIIFILFTTPAFYMPIILGYLDAFSLLYLSLAYLLFFDGFLDKYDYKKSILLSLSLLLSVLGRRYFAFPLIGFIIATLVYCIIKILISQEKKHLFVEYIKNAAVISFTSLGILVIFFRQFLTNSIFNNIKTAYSAYQSGDLLYNYKALLLYMGGIVFVSGIIGILYFVVFIKKLRVEFVFIIINILVTSILFYRVQSMGNHHYYILIVPIFLLCLIGIQGIVNKTKKTINRNIVSICIVLLFAANIFHSISYTSYGRYIDMMFTNQYMVPKVRNDLAELQSLALQLEKYSNEGQGIYVVASSVIINDDMIRKINMPDQLVSVPNLYVTSHVDLRDGFPTQFFDANIVVVATPTQYHLGEDSQRVIGVVADAIEPGGLLSKNFTVIDEIFLESGVKATIYMKSLPYTVEQIMELKEMFNYYYSSYPDLFGNRFDDYLLVHN